MACWHIHRPITPVPIQPIRVMPGSAFVMVSPRSEFIGVLKDGRYARGKPGPEKVSGTFFVLFDRDLV
jgi:hypothetical protein